MSPNSNNWRHVAVWIMNQYLTNSLTMKFWSYERMHRSTVFRNNVSFGHFQRLLFFWFSIVILTDHLLVFPHSFFLLTTIAIMSIATLGFGQNDGDDYPSDVAIKQSRTTTDFFFSKSKSFVELQIKSFV